MTQGTFDAAALANIIAQIRGTALGCTFQLPQPEGGTVDQSKVNVDLSLDGGQSSNTIPKRSDPNDACTTDGCWDYSGGQIQLIGKSCDNVKSGGNVKVSILVGCQTVVK